MVPNLKSLSLPTRGSRHPLQRFHADQGPVSVVDRLKTTESISQGARSIRFVPDIMNGFCMRQTAKLQYHCYRISEFDSSLCSSVCYTGNKALARLTGYAALCPRRSGVSSTAHVADRSNQLNLFARGPGHRGAVYRKPTNNKKLS